MPTTDFTYPLAADETATLKITVGDGQPGGITVLRGTKILWTGGGRRFPKSGVELGTGAQLAGKHVIATVVVKNQNPQTGKSSVTFEVSGGENPRPEPLKDQDGPKGEEIPFVAVIGFSS